MLSNQNEVTMNEVVVSNPLAARIVKILKMDDGSKIEKFLSREVKAQQRAIDVYESNREAAKLQLTRDLSNISDKIEDAEVSVVEAYEAITITDVKNNDAMDNFSTRYWSRISTQENALEALIKKQENIQEDFDKEIKEIEKQIAKRKARIAAIS